MQKLQDSVFSIVKTTNLSPAVFSFLQPTEDNSGMFGVSDYIIKNSFMSLFN